MKIADSAWAPPPALLKQWNKRLAQEHLSVFAGTNHRLLYLDCHPNTLDNIAGSDHPRNFVTLGGAGDTDRALFLRLALQGLSEEEITLLRHYESKTAPEIAALYGIKVEATKKRVRRIMNKLLRTAKALEASLFRR